MLRVVERNSGSVQAEVQKKYRLLLWQRSIVRTAEIDYRTVPLFMCLREGEDESGHCKRAAEASPLGKSRHKFLYQWFQKNIVWFQLGEGVIFNYDNFNDPFSNITSEKDAVVIVNRQWDVKQK